MVKSTYFVQDCPTCGRKLEIRVEYLGRDVVCQHCGKQFCASDQSLIAAHDQHQARELIERAEMLLRRAAEQRGIPFQASGGR